MDLSRRGLLAGIVASCAAPAIVRAGLIMPIKPGLLVRPQARTVWTAHHASIHHMGPTRMASTFTKYPVMDGAGIWSGDLLTIDPKTGCVRPMRDMYTETFHCIAVESVA